MLIHCKESICSIKCRGISLLADKIPASREPRLSCNAITNKIDEKNIYIEIYDLTKIQGHRKRWTGFETAKT